MAFTYHGRRLSSTFLPDVPMEQGWTKDETLLQLARKAGARLSIPQIKNVVELIRYKGEKSKLLYTDYQKLMDGPCKP